MGNRRATPHALVLAAIVAAGGAALSTTSERTASEAAQPGASPARAPATPHRRGCRTRIEGEGPFRIHRRQDVVIGDRVVFFGLRRAANPPRWEWRARRRQDHQWKAAVAVRAGGATTLVVPGSQRGRYALNYASRDGGHARPIAAVGKGQNAVRLTPCPPETPTFRRTGTVGEWTAFSGGFIIRGSGCVTVDAYVPGRRRPLSARIRFDARRSACS